MSYVLAIDQGTTSTRAIIFNKDLEIVASFPKGNRAILSVFWLG